MSPVMTDALITLVSWLAIAFGVVMVYIADRTAKPTADGEFPAWRFQLIGRTLKAAIGAMVIALILVGIRPFV